MAKYYRIRWTDEDIKELKRAVSNFNAKINRISKKEPSIKNLLPEKVSAKELKDLISTRNDLKREINALKRFSKRGAEEIVNIPNNTIGTRATKWQISELNRRGAIVNRKRKLRADELGLLPAKSRGEELGYTVGQMREYIGMGNIREVELRPTKSFLKDMTAQEVKMRYKSFRYQSKTDYFTEQDYKVKENYIKALYENYAPEDIQAVVDVIEKMDIKDFMDTFYEEGATFEFASPDGNDDFKRYEYEGYVEAIKSTWL